MSQAVRDSDEDLDTSPVHQLGRVAMRTAVVEELVRPASPPLHDLYVGREVVAEVAGLGFRRLNLTCLPTLVVSRKLAPLVRAFRDVHRRCFNPTVDPENSAEL